MNVTVLNDAREERFKAGMQLLAATTTVITATHEGQRSGMAATAVSSLTADPPSLLICTNRTSRTYGFIMDSRRFAVNLIPDDLPEVVNAFASKGDKEQQFLAAGNWRTSDNGLPILEEAVACFECRVDNWVNTKTHAVFFGMVDDVHLKPDKSPLIFARRGFQRIVPLGNG